MIPDHKVHPLHVSSSYEGSVRQDDPTGLLQVFAETYHAGVGKNNCNTVNN
jgi:hypothetical protein